jgi:hypothetical protein
MSNFPRFIGFWEFPNHKFRFPICYQIPLNLGNFPRSGTTKNESQVVQNLDYSRISKDSWGFQSQI